MEMAMRDVVHIIDDLRIGGAQRLLVTFAEQAAKHQIDTTIISLCDRHDSPISEQLSSYGARVIQCSAVDRRGLSDHNRLARLVRLLQELPANSVHSHLSYANILGSVAGKLARKKVIGTFHGIIDRKTGLSLKDRIEYGVLRVLADRVLSVGDFVSECHRPYLGDQEIITIPNAVNAVQTLSPTEKQRIKQALIGDASRPLILSLGRLSEEKGYSDLLNAFARVREFYPDAALAIAGADGGCFDELQSEIQHLELHGQAFLLGARTDVHQLLGAADIYICSSHREGLPLSLLEAMSAGLAIVSTRVGSIPEVINPHTGLLVPAYDVSALSSAIQSLLASPERRFSLGEAAKTFIQESFDIKVWFDRWLALY
jgi:glycosyltransferase involved in cell wall biosynthesis